MPILRDHVWKSIRGDSLRREEAGQEDPVKLSGVNRDQIRKDQGVNKSERREKTQFTADESVNTERKIHSRARARGSSFNKD